MSPCAYQRGVPLLPAFQAAVARQAKHVVDAVRFTPTHQLVVGEAAVGAKNDAHTRPALADLGDNARHLLDSAVTARDIRTPLAGQQQVPAAEHVERQVAVLIIIPVKKATFLHPVDWDVGVVEIQHDFARCTRVRFEEEVNQQRIDLHTRRCITALSAGAGAVCSSASSRLWWPRRVCRIG